MMIARWQIHARFGHRTAALELMKRWWSEIAPQIGWSADQVRILTGSVGAQEAEIEVEVEISDLGDLSEAWKRLAQTRGQEKWAEDLEPHVASGTSRWTVYRVV
jgi:hypothetical protein